MNNSNRWGKFTSSNVYKLIKEGRGKEEFSAPGLTYIQEKAIERKMQSCLDGGAHTQSLAWGNFMELMVYSILGVQYQISSKETTLHSVHGKFWSGSKDLFTVNNETGEMESIAEIKKKKKGKDGFYKGDVADLFIAQVKEMNGYITHKDLESYKPIEREPVFGSYRDHSIISMGPPSSGGIALVELLNVLENFSIEKEDWGSSQYINRLVETMKYVYADRTYHLGDEDFYPVPKQKLTSKEYAKSIFDKLTTYAKPSEEITTQIPVEVKESTETTHYSVYDKEGNAVSVTTTINSGFGSKIVVDGAGFLLNNEMDDFSAKPGEPNQFGLLGAEANSIQPEKRMLSAMTPTIVLKNGKPYIITGSPGGSTIITVVLQVILNCIDFEMNIQEAVNAPRIHHQWMPDIIYLEEFAINNDAKENLEKMGYKFGNRNESFRVLGSAQSIMIDEETGNIYGAADPRRGKAAAVGF
ncbi:MAG: gamma-glutamyltransferase [Ignavibacteriae bacterium]|nr:gamma-glutamyltransferase [Ignavibacteriota bacterium]